MTRPKLDDNLAEAISSALRLTADQLADDPDWAIAQLETICRDTLIDWHRTRRDHAASDQRLAFARRVVQSRLADHTDFSALAHAYSDVENLRDAIHAMEIAAAKSPCPEYFQFLTSVYERDCRLAQSLDAVGRGLHFSADSVQLQSDQLRILTALELAGRNSPDASLLLWEHRGRKLGAGLRIACAIVGLSIKRIFWTK